MKKKNNKNEIIIKPNSNIDPIKATRKEMKLKLKTVSKRRIKKALIYMIMFVIVVTIFNVVTSFFKADKKIPNYPIVYYSSEGNLTITNSSAKKTSKLATNVESVVRYANTTDRYVLYTKEDSLYLYDSKKGAETTRVGKNVSNIFGFNNDDKYVYYLNNENDLYVYKKEKVKIDDEVEVVLGISDKNIVYEKNRTIYYRDLKAKHKPVEITSGVISKNINEDATKLIYVTEDEELYLYEIGSKKPKKIATDVNRILDVDDTLSNYIYSNKDSDLYLVKGTKPSKIVSDVDSLYYVDAKDGVVVYSLDKKLYYQKGNKKPVSVTKSNNISSAYIQGNGLYFTAYNNKQYDLYYSKIGSRASKPRVVLKDVDDNIITGYKKGLLVMSNREGNTGILNLVNGNRNKKIAEKVKVSSVTYSHDKKTVYFLGNYEDNKNEGTLMKSTGGKAKNILEDVYEFNYIKDKLIYVQQNYSNKKKTVDLKVLYNGSLLEIENNIQKDGVFGARVIVK